MLLGVALGACAKPGRPPQLARAAEVAASPAAKEAELWAPQAHARALQLEQRAEAALAREDAETAALLAEQAIAAHEHAWALTRLARAERRRLAAEAELAEQRRALDALQSEQQRLVAEAAGLQLRARAAGGDAPGSTRSAEGAPLPASRRQAAAALGAQARLLCVAARLLGEVERVQALLPRLDELERALASGAPGATVQGAASLRRECLQIITDVRHRNAAPAARRPDPPRNTGGAPLPADVVLDELSAMGAAPSRDERGVAVALRGVLGADGNVTEAARQELASLGKVAGAHRDFPLLLVAHGPSAELEQQLGAVKAELGRHGVGVETERVGERLPLVPPGGPGARERNARLELVFVAPAF